MANITWDNSQIYEKASKRLILGALYGVMVMSVLNVALLICFYSISDFQNTMECMILLLSALFICIVNIAAIVAMSVIPLIYRRKLYMGYAIGIIVLLYPISVILFASGNVLPVFYFLTIAMYFYVFVPEKAIWHCICFFCLMISTVILSLFWRYYIPNDWTFVYLESHFFSLILHVINIFPIFFLIYHALHYARCFRQMETDYLLDIIRQTDSKKAERLTEVKNEEKSKYDTIYSQILKYMEMNEPYLNVNFSLVQMAHDLNIYSGYLSKAINSNKGMNFNNFVNIYRIEKAKKQIQTDSSKYTLTHIYRSSGFKNQPSFNRAFKLQEGVTPSEYMSRMQQK